MILGNEGDRNTTEEVANQSMNSGFEMVELIASNSASFNYCVDHIAWRGFNKQTACTNDFYHAC